MNSVTISGYVATGARYIAPIDLYEAEYRFFIKAFATNAKRKTLIAVKAIGWLADKCYSELSENCYVEIIGEMIRESAEKTYVVPITICYRKPKERKQFYIRSTEFFDAYKPQSVMKRLNKNENREQDT